MLASSRLYRWQRLTWVHPEWWPLCLCALAWLLILWRTGVPGAGMHITHHHGHHMAAAGPASSLQSMPLAADSTVIEEATGGTFWWLIMIVAMMFPLLLEPIRVTGARSLWRRRHLAIAEFLVGYLGPWMLFGIAGFILVSILRIQSPRQFAIAAAAGFAAAALWQAAVARRRAVIACHRTRPIAPAGWRADCDCLRYGWAVGSSCVLSCWALMLACLLAGHALPPMIGATAVVWAERNTPRPNQFLLSGVIAAFALSCLFLPVL